MSKMLINAYSLNANQIRHIYSLDGVVHKETVNFKPFLGTHAMKNENTAWKDMYGNPVKVKVFDNIMEMYSWKKENKEVLDIFGDIDVVNMFIASRYRDTILLDRTGMTIFNIDIEVFTPDGVNCFNDNMGKYPISAITINEMVSNKYYTFAYVDYQVKHENEIFIPCKNEMDLIQKYLDFWEKSDPQIITGWNINSFDIPYLFLRINSICGPESVKRLSKDRVVKSRKVIDKLTGREDTYYDLQGHIIWDYQELYKKYCPEPREMYSLDFIAETELGDEKLSYKDDYENLNDLYTKNPQLFLEYNIKDTALVSDLDYKLDYLNVAMSIMHKAKCKPEKIFGTIEPWDCIIYNKLLSLKILCPPKKHHSKESFVGGYVVDPVPGLYEWLEVDDIVSSYPNQIRSYNLSPETALPDTMLPPELITIKDRYTGIDKCADLNYTAPIKEALQKYKVSFTSNGYFFDISKEGIIPSIFTELFALRKDYKRQLKEHKKAGRDREAKIADLYQYTIKILLNSGYGALANHFSRYYDLRIGEAITSNGQVACKGMIKTLKDELGLDVAYADTDSNFIQLLPVLQKRFGDKIDQVDRQTKVDFLLKYREKCIAPALDNFFKRLSENMNMRELTIGVEGECIAEVSLIKRSKMYIMNKVWDEGTFYIDNPKKKIRGIEIVRSSTPKIVREKMKEIVDVMFGTKSNDEVIKLIEDFKQQFKDMPIEQIAFPRGAKFSDYTMQSKGLPIAVKAAFAFNEYLVKMGLDTKYIKIADGSKIKYCYIKQPNHVKSHVIGFENKLPAEMKGTFDIDFDLQFEKAFLAPVQSLLDVIGWKTEHKESLEDFFS